MGAKSCFCTQDACGEGGGRGITGAFLAGSEGKVGRGGGNGIQALEGKGRGEKSSTSINLQRNVDLEVPPSATDIIPLYLNRWPANIIQHWRDFLLERAQDAFRRHFLLSVLDFLSNHFEPLHYFAICPFLCWKAKFCFVKKEEEEEDGGKGNQSMFSLRNTTLLGKCTKLR